MTTRILIARHGNTFHKGQTPTRVGSNTDLPLVEETLGRNLGKYLKSQNLIPTIIWAAPLQRTLQTAKLAIAEMHADIELQQDEQFLEIDYGPDENKTEEEVTLRLGQCQVIKEGDKVENYTTEELQEKGAQVIANWNTKAIVPTGWQVELAQYINTWQQFAAMVAAKYQQQIVMVVSSNGVMRFAPYITQDFNEFSTAHNIKVATGNLCVFEKSSHELWWNCIAWNINPTEQLVLV